MSKSCVDASPGSVDFEAVSATELRPIGRGTSALREGADLVINPGRVEKGERLNRIIHVIEGVGNAIDRLRVLPSKTRVLPKILRTPMGVYRRVVQLTERGDTDRANELLDRLYKAMEDTYGRGLIDERYFLCNVPDLEEEEAQSLWNLMVERIDEEERKNMGR